MSNNLNQGASIEAERELFEKTLGPKDTFAWRNADGSYQVYEVQRAWEIWQAARRTPAATTGELPPLLSPMSVETVVEIADKYEYQDPESGNTCFDRLGFAQEVARAAIEADRHRQQKEIDYWSERTRLLLAEVRTLRAQLAAKGQGELAVNKVYCIDCEKEVTAPCLKAMCPASPARLQKSAPASAQPADPFAGQRFLNWNRSQPKPPVQIGKELGIARKVLELAGAQPDQRDSANNGAGEQKGGAK